jgi:hypothetical protein
MFPTTRVRVARYGGVEGAKKDLYVICGDYYEAHYAVVCLVPSRSVPLVTYHERLNSCSHIFPTKVF